MFHHQVYAEINNKIVKNIIVCNNYEMANILAKNNYGSESIAIECTYWACEISDTYENNRFYDKDGNEREYKGNEVENINILKSENTKLNSQISEDNETILDLQFQNDLLQDDSAEMNEAILDIDYRVSQIEDKEVA